MKLLILLATLAVCQVALGRKSEEDWKKFKGKHGKKYKDGKDESRRRKIWEDKDDQIEKHNNKANRGEVSYTMGHNDFSDWTTEEQALVNGLKVTKTDLPMNPTNISDVPLPVLRALPLSVDLRTDTCMSPIVNQGQCGSCWSFSATAMVDYYNCKKGNLVRNSQQHLVSCDMSDNACNGGFYTTAWDWVINNRGQCSLASYPYTSGTTLTRGACNPCTKTGRVNGKSAMLTTEAAIQNALATTGPVSAAIFASNNFMYYTGGVYSETGCPTGVNHAVNIVGYGSTSTTPYWIVRNSWSTFWGINGYALVQRGVNMCGIESLGAFPIVL